MEYILKFGKELAGILAEMSPYLLLGFFFAGIMHLAIPERKVLKYLGGSNFKSVFNASLLGVPLPLCSCGVIPTGLSFYRHGASKASTVSFLISTPQTGVDSIMVTWSLLGLPFAIIRPVVAFITGLFGGLLTKKIEGKAEEQVQGTENGLKIKPSGFFAWVKELFRYPFVEFMQDISKWLVLGILIAALISVAIPDNFFADKLPGNFAGMIMMLVLAIPVYICATASVPIAAVLIMKGLSPGAALVLLMAGPATNAATITMIAKTMGRKALFGYLAAIISGALAAGSVIDYLLPSQWFVITSHAAHAGHSNEILPAWLKAGSAILLSVFVINALIRRYLLRKPVSGMKKTGLEEDSSMRVKILSVEGMTCNHCRTTVENSAKDVEGVYSADADLQTGRLTIKGTGFDLGQIVKNIEKSGYTVKQSDITPQQ
ncbi:MAG: heavy metal-associated domain-containing protein [Bacteroidales bacterium]|nr:heavy metal-associated domain-containing protein [Bacteroidales bacterium]